MEPHGKRDFAALTFAMLFPLAMAYVYFVVLAGEPGQPGSPAMLAYGLGKVLQFGFPIVFVLLVDRSQFRFRRPTLAGLELAVGFGLLVAAAMLTLYFVWLKTSPLLEGTPQKIYAKIQEFHIAGTLGYVAMALFVSVAHSFMEEYYWRWFVYRWLKRHMSVTWAIVLSSVGFMLHHIVVLGVYFPDQIWTLALPFAIGVAVGGGVWAWIYERSGSLLGPWLSHAIVDGAIMVAGFDMVRHFW